MKDSKISGSFMHIFLLNLKVCIWLNRNMTIHDWVRCKRNFLNFKFVLFFTFWSFACVSMLVCLCILCACVCMRTRSCACETISFQIQVRPTRAPQTPINSSHTFNPHKLDPYLFWTHPKLISPFDWSPSQISPISLLIFGFLKIMAFDLWTSKKNLMGFFFRCLCL